jgi:hypothetical protein
LVGSAPGGRSSGKWHCCRHAEHKVQDGIDDGPDEGATLHTYVQLILVTQNNHLSFLKKQQQEQFQLSN